MSNQPSRRMNAATRAQWLVEKQRNIKRDAPTQRDLDFTALQTAISDENFERLFLNLFLQICEFVQEGFGDHIVVGQASPWGHKYTTQFYNLVKTIARPGSDGSQWDELLRDTPQRCALLQGIIVKALEKNVFSKLLFGATPVHAKLLETEDETLINVEGFKRTHLRAETNKMYIQTLKGKMPPLFWDEVDKVAAQIMRMLLPLYAVFGDYTEPGTRDQKATYKLLHDIVANAAWLSVGFRLSPKIIAFDWVEPGEPYRFEHVSVGAEEDEDGGNNHGRPRQQRVMICAAPNVTIHSRGAGRNLRGREKYTIMNARVVCYFGKRRDDDDEANVIPLDQHVRTTRSSMSRFFMSLFWFMLKVFIILMVLYWLWLAQTKSGRRFLVKRFGKWAVMRSHVSWFSVKLKFA